MYTRRTQAPHRQGQKFGENEKDKYVSPEVNTSKRLGSAGDYALLDYTMEKTFVACWKSMAVETICKRGKEVTV